MSVKLRVHYVYEYEANPEDYPEGQRDPAAMAKFDFDVEPAVVLHQDGEIKNVEVVTEEGDATSQNPPPAIVFVIGDTPSEQAAYAQGVADGVRETLRLGEWMNERSWQFMREGAQAVADLVQAKVKEAGDA